MRRFVAAQWFCGHIISGCLKGPSPAAAANALVFAITAFAGQPLKIAQPCENFGRFPDGVKGGLGYITAVYMQKTAGLHDTGMGNKTKARSPQAPAGNRVKPVGLERYGFALV